jgi:hypothetical protein
MSRAVNDPSRIEGGSTVVALLISHISKLSKNDIKRAMQYTNKLSVLDNRKAMLILSVG